MKKSLLFLSALVAGALTLLFADDHREGEKERERDKSRAEERERAERIKKEELRIYEAAREGKITREEGRRELEKIHQRERANRSDAEIRREKETIEKAHQIRRKQQVEHEKERFWKRVEEEIEGAVRSGRMTRKQADAEYERIKKLKTEGRSCEGLHREIEEGMRERILQSVREKSARKMPGGKGMRCVVTWSVKFMPLIVRLILRHRNAVFTSRSRRDA